MNTAILAAHLALTLRHPGRNLTFNSPAVIVSTAACIHSLARAHQKCWVDHMSDPVAAIIDAPDRARNIVREIRETLRPFAIEVQDESDQRQSATIRLITRLNHDTNDDMITLLP